jgi:hypothetical protein
MPAPVALVINFTFALVAYVLFAWWYIVPTIAGLPARRVLPPLLLVHLMRPVSLWLLVPGGIVRPTLPASFATGTAYGDLIATTLALIAAVLVRYELKGAIAMAWIFNVVGLADALRNCAVGMMTEAPTHMGAAVFIPAFGVPLLLVSHALIFKVLLDQRRARQSE